MPRPLNKRIINFQPDLTFFKPAGVPLAGLEEVVLAFEEVEALRLKEVNGLGQTEAAKEMGVSQPTFFRILSSARKKTADALVNGKAIRLEGGSFSFGRAGRRMRGKRYWGDV